MVHVPEMNAKKRRESIEREVQRRMRGVVNPRFITYVEARPKMNQGDIIAFGGKGPLSGVIKLFTCSPVSHVGVVLKTKMMDDKSGRYFNQVIESTQLNGNEGVKISRLSARLAEYDGEVWWLPLAEVLSETAAEDFWNFLWAQEGKPYDTKQALQSAIDILPFGPGVAEEDFGEFFCSELVAAAFEEAGVIKSINASEITPIELCRWNIYSDYYQLKGQPLGIPGFNTRRVK